METVKSFIINYNNNHNIKVLLNANYRVSCADKLILRKYVEYYHCKTKRFFYYHSFLINFYLYIEQLNSYYNTKSFVDGDIIIKNEIRLLLELLTRTNCIFIYNDYMFETQQICSNNNNNNNNIITIPDRTEFVY